MGSRPSSNKNKFSKKPQKHLNFSVKCPQNLEEYKQWLEEVHGENLEKRERWYKLVTPKIKYDIENSEFWKSLHTKLKTIAIDYKREKGYELFGGPIEEPELLIKSFESLLSKNFRYNVVNNRNWPSQPKKGWMLPKNWFSKVNDIVRARIVVKYLDGAKYIIPIIKNLAEDNRYTFANPSFQNREEGYYAVHLYISKLMEIPGLDYDIAKEEVKVEIQLTTLLQEVICKMLHRPYESKRDKVKNKNELPWQWDYEGDEFAINYLGHILHYVEGMIMDVRKRQDEGKNGKI